MPKAASVMTRAPLAGGFGGGQNPEMTPTDMKRSPWPWVALAGFMLPAVLALTFHFMPQLQSSSPLPEPYNYFALGLAAVLALVWFFAISKTLNLMKTRQSAYRAATASMPIEPQSWARKLLLWYLPQGGLFALGAYAASQDNPQGGMRLAIIAGVLLAVVYTGAAMLVLNLLARLRGRVGGGRHGGLPGSHGLGLIGARRDPSKPPEHLKSTRVRH